MALIDDLEARLHKALELAQADARMGRHVNIVEIEAVKDDFIAEIQRLRDELEFYALEANWTAPPDPSPAEEDAGEKARLALEE